MARIREIPRTAAFAWSPGSDEPILATGTRAGAVDADFSNETQLELWDLNLDASQRTELQPTASVGTDSRFHDIAWVEGQNGVGRGVIAGALENGSLDLWSADKLLVNSSDAHISRTSKHSGAIKTLQFNPFRSELLATAGAKGELFISDTNNIENPFRLGNTAARADDFECLDWNKKVAHILVTGSSGGFVTVWDVKAKKESLTLNNYGRKPVGAVAWDPEKPTRLITAVPMDTDPLILVWDLRNSNAPEKILRGHEGGVLSLSWCKQDSDLLLSCGKDNRTVCWNPQSGETYGEFPVVTNWTFQTRWNPYNPSILATASFDGKIAIRTIQNTRPSGATSVTVAPVDGEDFFNQAQTQPQGSSFSLPKAPKWLDRPVGANFAFGGKIVSFHKISNDTIGSRRSVIKLSSFSVNSEVESMTGSFEKAMIEKNLRDLCSTRIEQAKNETEKSDWKVMKTLLAAQPKKELVNYLGVSSEANGEESDPSEDQEPTNGQADSLRAPLTANTKTNRLSAFFDSEADGDNFLADLASTKGAKTNSPFSIYSSDDSQTDRKITSALMLGQFDQAMEHCLRENRLSDAFMIATCGGKESIEKVQKVYFKQQSSGPRYVRLLASIVGKNLWDIVYNAELNDWKEVMATICTYAKPDEFPDLCEALGDRLEEQTEDRPESSHNRRDASFCYLAGSKLEKVVKIWISELAKPDAASKEEVSAASAFENHTRSLQSLIEKVTVFREVTKYQDTDKRSTSDWKLGPLYEKYVEYGDILATSGQMQAAEKYLDLVPDKYPGADIARNRVKQATRRAPVQPATRQLNPSAAPIRPASTGPVFENQTVPSTNRAYAPASTSYQAANAPSGPYAPQQPSYYSQHSQPSHVPPPQPGRQQFGMPQPPQFGATPQLPHSLGPPPRNMNASPPIPPPSKATNMTNWNDTPEDFFKPPTGSRRGTPAIQQSTISNPFPSQSPNMSTPPMAAQPFGQQPPPPPKAGQPIPPPPKSTGQPPRAMTLSGNYQPQQQSSRPSSSAANIYAPPQPAAGFASPPAPTIPRGPSPYNAPPAMPPVSNRYAPAPAVQQAAPPQQHAPPPPNPYAARPNVSSPPMLPSSNAPPPGPPPSGPSLSNTKLPPKAASVAPKHPPGDRSHIPENAMPIYEILNAEMQRIKGRAPASYKAHVNDAEKRLSMLFDHLNNQDLLQPNTVNDMVQLAEALQSRDYEVAMAIHIDIVTNRQDECGAWMTGIKRLISMSRATPQ